MCGERGHHDNCRTVAPPTLPGVQDSLVLGQLPHEGGVGLSDVALLLDVVVGLLQRPAVLLHGIGDYGGGGAAHPHLAVHQALGVVLPVGGTEGRTSEMSQLQLFFLSLNHI